MITYGKCVMMKKMKFVDAHDKGILIHGRTDLTQELIPMFWTGAGVEFITDSSCVELVFEADYAVREHWIRVTMDDATFIRMPLNKGRQRISLYMGMPEGAPKRIRFYKENQSTELDPSAILLFAGIYCDGELYPIEPRKRKLEVIGDSVSSGEGLMGPSTLIGGLSACFSTENHYVLEMCRRLGADFRIMSQSGWGAAYGWNNMPSLAMPLYYREICSVRGSECFRRYGGEKENCFENWKPDVILVHLGNNDAFAMNEPAYTDPDTGKTYRMCFGEDGKVSGKSAEDITGAVYGFLKLLRECNPNSRLVWIYGMFGTELEEAIRSGVDRFNEEKNDAEYIRIPSAAPEDYGSNNHPGQPAHLKLGEFLADRLERLF